MAVTSHTGIEVTVEHLQAFADASWNDAHHFICGDRGVSEWVFRGTRADAPAWKCTGATCSAFATAALR